MAFEDEHRIGRFHSKEQSENGNSLGFLTCFSFELYLPRGRVVFLGKADQRNAMLSGKIQNWAATEIGKTKTETTQVKLFRLIFYKYVQSGGNN